MGAYTFAYDGSHRVTGETLGETENESSYSSAGALATQTWGSSGSPSKTAVSPAVTLGLGGFVAGPVTASETDPLGNVTAWQMDAQGRPVVQVAANGGVTTTGYSNGFVTSVTDPLNRTTTYALDTKDYVTQVTNPDGSTLEYAYQTAYHAMTSSTDQLGNTTTYA